MRPLGGIEIRYSTSEYLQPDSCWVDIHKWPIVTVVSRNEMNTDQIIEAISHALDKAETHKTYAWMNIQDQKHKFAEGLADIIKTLESANAKRS